jgi:hypothetical protein
VGPFRFRIQGVVREADSGRPLAGMFVQAYDKDVLFDDFLGSAHTDSEGRFEIQFTQLAFQDVMEQRPDVYLRVFDPTARTELYTTMDAVRRNARVEEHFEIVIPATRMETLGSLP